jgi:tyrosyl-tRNA synthetase
LIDPATLHKLLRRGVSDIIVEEEFVRLLQAGKPLRLKMGFDPSRPDLHLGHAVGLRKLRQLQDMGHQAILIVGDWTAQIGDTSDKSATRPMLTAEEVRANAETYMRQFFRVVDRERTQTVWQSEWFGKFTLANVFDLTRRFTVAQFLARDDFAQRFRAQRPIAITELLYPLLQAYDSVQIKADVEFGGSDQRFNILVGRELQGMMGQRPQQCFIMPLLVGTDGVQKMSKSLGNYIGVEDPPNEMYGRVMSIPDSLMMDYFELVTDVPDEELAEMRQALEAQSVNPMELKKRLAREIVAQFHDTAATQQAEATFERVVQRGEVPEEDRELISIPVASASIGSEVPIVPLIVRGGLVESSNEAKRLLTQGAIQVDGNTLTTPTARLRDGSLIRVGKRRYARIVNVEPPQG